MKRHLLWIGTGLLVAVFPLMLMFTSMRVERHLGTAVLMLLAVSGFAMQMYSVFSAKIESEREMRRKKREHDRLMEQATMLPPEEAVSLLLKKVNQ